MVLFPPRGEIDHPQYYAHGADIPRALEAVDSAQRSTRVLDEELDAQLVGLARLVTEPANRAPLAGNPRLTVASDLHNNVLTVPILERSAGGGPVLFPGDLTDRGSPLEVRVVRRVVRSGHPFVFVSGNHDSDTVEAELADAGAIVLSERGRLNPDGSRGAVVQRVAGLRVAGYSDPFARRSAENYADRFQPTPTAAQQDAFTSWMRSIQDQVDVIMVHEPKLIEPALAVLHDRPPSHPLLFVTGHTHRADLTTQPGVTVVNGGSIGGGGTGNLAEVPDDGRRDRPRDLHHRAPASARWRSISCRSIREAVRRPRAACGSTSDKTAVMNQTATLPAPQPRVLADLLAHSRVRDAALVLGAALLTAACAQISIPLPGDPVPVTGQTFAVLLTGAALGANRGAARPAALPRRWASSACRSTPTARTASTSSGAPPAATSWRSRSPPGSSARWPRRAWTARRSRRCRRSRSAR